MGVFTPGKVQHSLDFEFIRTAPPLGHRPRFIVRRRGETGVGTADLGPPGAVRRGRPCADELLPGLAKDRVRLSPQACDLLKLPLSLRGVSNSASPGGPRLDLIDLGAGQSPFNQALKLDDLRAGGFGPHGPITRHLGSSLAQQCSKPANIRIHVLPPRVAALAPAHIPARRSRRFM